MVKGEPHPFLSIGWRTIQNKTLAMLGRWLWPGEDAVFLAERGWNVTAFDLSASAIDWVKNAFALIHILGSR